MATLEAGSRKPRLVLDAGAILALARGATAARAKLKRAIREGYVVIVPTPVVAQVHRGGRARAAMDRVLKAVDVFAPTSVETARCAGELLGRAGMADAVDAIVAAEALVGPASTILTSDPDDLSCLVETEAVSGHVFISRV